MLFLKPMIIFTTLRIRQDFLPSMQDFKNVPVYLCRLWTCQHSCITYLPWTRLARRRQEERSGKVSCLFSWSQLLWVPETFLFYCLYYSVKKERGQEKETAICYSRFLEFFCWKWRVHLLHIWEVGDRMSVASYKL